MGILNLTCITLNETRLVGVAFDVPSSEPRFGDNHDISIIVVQVGIPNPTTYTDMQPLSVISVWDRHLPSKVYAWPSPTQIMCSIDPISGVLTIVNTKTAGTFTYYGPSKYNSTSTIPGGFQFDPRTTQWRNIVFSSDYSWDGANDSSFALFTWPNTSTLYQATIGESNTINIGMLIPGNSGQDNATFVNSFNWTLVKRSTAFSFRSLKDILLSTDVLHPTTFRCQTIINRTMGHFVVAIVLPSVISFRIPKSMVILENSSTETMLSIKSEISSTTIRAWTLSSSQGFPWQGMRPRLVHPPL
jgi:hypothetical protein